MSDHVLHLGTTRVVIASQFGAPIIGIGDLLGPVRRVGSFDDAVQASIFTAAIKRGLEGEGIAWYERRPGEAIDLELLAQQVTAARARYESLRDALAQAEQVARERAAAEL